MKNEELRTEGGASCRAASFWGHCTRQWPKKFFPAIVRDNRPKKFFSGHCTRQWAQKVFFTRKPQEMGSKSFFRAKASGNGLKKFFSCESLRKWAQKVFFMPKPQEIGSKSFFRAKASGNEAKKFFSRQNLRKWAPARRRAARGARPPWGRRCNRHTPSSYRCCRSG